MKYCEAYAALLDPYIDGELSAEEAARVRAHLEECGGCRAYVEAALAIRDAFPDGEDTEVPDGFAEGIMAAVRAGAAPQKKRRAPWAKVLLPLAACCAVVVLVRGIPHSVSDNAAAPASADAEMAAKAGPQESLGDLTCSVDGCEDFSVDTPSPRITAEEAPAVQDSAQQKNGAVPYTLQEPASEPETPAAEEPPAVAPMTTTTPEDTGATPEVAPETVSPQNQTDWEVYFTVLRIPAELSGCLPADLAPAAHADGESKYELTAGEYDALTAALAEAGEEPEVLFSAPEKLDSPDSRALVYVTDA